MKFGIVTDSGCDLKVLNADTAEEIAFSRAPMKLTVGDKEFTDDIGLNVPDYLDSLHAYKGKTSSAAPSIGEWYQAFVQADEVFAVTISSMLSGSYQSAVAARQLVLEDFPNKNIYVIDSKLAGPGQTMLVLKIKEFIAAGMSFDEIVLQIDNYHKKTNLVFVLESLENFIKNGRVSRLQGGLAGLLGIKFLCSASEEGNLSITKKCRGKLTAYSELIKQVLKQGYNGSKIIISHCLNPEMAQYVKKMIGKSFSKCDISIMETSGLCSYYAEKGGVLVAFES